VGAVIDERRLYSDHRFDELKAALVHAPGICQDKACVYAIGSFGRREASEHSDLDLFIVSLCHGESKERKSRLTKLEEILLKADLIRASRTLGFPDFSKDGDFLQHHSAISLIETTGDRNDDAINTFTARLLLLLESKPLVAEEVHSQIINDVIAKYWSEFPEHNECFMPAYLANDVLRFWRTLCLNYEAKTSEKTPRDRANRKIKNYKLKHSRMLTCYSALLFLLYIYDKNGTVKVEDTQAMVQMVPTQRLEWMANQLGETPIATKLQLLIDKYEMFLNVTSASESELIELFSNDVDAHRLRDQQSEFGEVTYEVLSSLGESNKFYRRLVI
jgi:predicted nucleotidyltransferase